VFNPPAPRRRCSASLAAALLLLVLAASPCAAQTADTAARPRGYKRPATARALGILYPGLGHVYAAEFESAYWIWSGTVGLPGALIFGLYAADSDLLADHPDAVVGAAVAAGVAVWAYGAFDAPRAAGRTNRERGFASRAPAAGAAVVIARGPVGEWRLGVALPLAR
jgi:hypothetical protein